MDRKHILFLLNSLTLTGVQRQAVSLVNGLDANRLRSSIAYLYPIETLIPEIQREQVRDLISCNVKGRFDWSCVRQLSEFIDRENVDVVVCNNPHSMVYGYLAERRANRSCPLVEVLHTTELPNAYERFKMHFYRKLFARFDRIVFVSEEQREYWCTRKRLRVRRAETIQNGIDLARYTRNPDDEKRWKLRLDLGFDREDLVVAVCAELRPEKRHLDALQALFRFRQEGAAAKLLIIGDGPERARIEREIQRLKLSDAVLLVGWQRDVRPFFEASDCSLLASDAETFSLSILESMALELPVVSTRVGGACEQIEPGVTGYLFSPRDIGGLVDHLRRLQNPDLRERLGQAARRKVEASFTVEQMVARYEELLLEV
jgi:glycosyltransferase involved in cell wall biosynthesis